jgi:hypothetical protein
LAREDRDANTAIQLCVEKVSDKMDSKSAEVMPVGEREKRPA